VPKKSCACAWRGVARSSLGGGACHDSDTTYRVRGKSGACPATIAFRCRLAAYCRRSVSVFLHPTVLRAPEFEGLGAGTVLATSSAVIVPPSTSFRIARTCSSASRLFPMRGSRGGVTEATLCTAHEGSRAGSGRLLTTPEEGETTCPLADHGNGACLEPVAHRRVFDLPIIGRETWRGGYPVVGATGHFATTPQVVRGSVKRKWCLCATGS